ncbi:MAG: ATP-binding cassette domain-containing protein, partial [Bacillota bacterium]|nr:ATP-binding cassette domain-containing protein [Bacillota bacterium]
MECYKIENLSFTYPERECKALDNINIAIYKGEFVTLCGKSGCGKTTMLRLLKPLLAPHGSTGGSIYYMGHSVHELSHQVQASEIGFVMQSAENQIVTDKVWHELAFGLEGLGYDT